MAPSDTPRSTTDLWPNPQPRPEFPAIETDVLGRWQRDDVFAESMRLRTDGDVWTFYEGPPTANGRPGTHHVEARVFKDIFPRYRAMKGYHVRRKAGWDCHGLPVELEVERELGLDSKADIEAYGIEAFNAKCRESVQRYVSAFEDLTERIGFWIDTDDPYRTMDPEYIDSLWWGLKQLWEADLIFRDFRVTPYCARCGTGLSDAEVAQGYREVDDPSVFVRFPVISGPLADAGASLVVWTTTPWTLPSNVACAVGLDIDYVVARTSAFGSDDELLVIATDLLTKVLGEHAEIIRNVSADELVGIRYQAPFDFVDIPATPGVHTVTYADFVTAADGSGIVHMAPAFGADDMSIGRREQLPTVNPVDTEGRFTAGPWLGQFVKDADSGIVADLADRHLLIAQTTYRHTYPFCWRCDRPLIYWAKPSWYIRTTARRDELLDNNATIDWHPGHIRDGRFGNWLENNVDWALSRDRYWGTPLPFWCCDTCDHVEVVASRAELAGHLGQDLSDLDPHRPYVDELTWPCPCGNGTLVRVADVADAWFDSGGMPYAQWGYPHTGVDEFKQHYPADYICEAIDQTRGWFYTLLAESTLLFGDSSYKTCLCLGHIVDEDGRKMSKSTGNVIDPWELIDKHGADALRWLMFAEGNPWVSRRVGHQLLEDVVRRFLLTLWNTHVFFLTYAKIDGFSLEGAPPPLEQRPASDRWILAELADVVTVVDTALDRYDVSTSTRRLERFVDDLSNWYVRRNRRRFWKSVADAPDDKMAAYHTLHTCLVTLARLLAPFTPFIADRLWHDLQVIPTGGQAPSSVHLTDFPQVDDRWRNDELRRAMGTARRLVELGRQTRNDSGVRVRQPLGRALISVGEHQQAGLSELVDDIADELNVKQVEISGGTEDLVSYALKPNFRALGPAFASRAPHVAQAIGEITPSEAAQIAQQIGAGPVTIDVDGSPTEVTADMIDVVRTPKTGWELARDGALAFALDTTLTRELQVEGALRDIIRAVNDHRKVRNLALDARIELTLQIDDELAHDLQSQRLLDEIAREVLATKVAINVPSTDAVAVDLGLFGTARFAIGQL
ncbi:MAG: isoleucine--tRNA ligase [Nitriliruptoraceae bacterium]